MHLKQPLVAQSRVSADVVGGTTPDLSLSRNLKHAPGAFHLYRARQGPVAGGVALPSFLLRRFLGVFSRPRALKRRLDRCFGAVRRTEPTVKHEAPGAGRDAFFLPLVEASRKKQFGVPRRPSDI